MPFWIQLVVPVGVILVLATVVWKGFVNGDDITDALAKVRLVKELGPEGGRLFASVSVTNRTPGIVIVAARSGPISWVRFETGVQTTRGTSVIRSQELNDRELLGAVEAGEERTFTARVDDRGKRYVRVIVEIDQPERRTRVITTMHDLRVLSL